MSTSSALESRAPDTLRTRASAHRAKRASIVDYLGQRWLIARIAILTLAAALRAWDLGHIKALVFDETYYVPGGLSMTRYGVERKMIDKWPDVWNSGNHSVFTSEPDFVVHPPLGKWVIGLGEAIGGDAHPWSWRLGTVLCGIAVVALVMAIAARLTTQVWALVAGLLMAMEGMSFVESRTGILDTVLTVAAMAGIYAALRARDSVMAPWGHRWLNPWRIAAAAAFGAATGVKFSGAVLALVLLILLIAWDMKGLPRSSRSTFIKASLRIVGMNSLIVGATSGLVYVATWAGWFITRDGYGASASSNIVVSWLKAQKDMLSLGSAINSPHHWQAAPWAWWIQARPTMFYTVDTTCTDASQTACAQVVTSLGTAPLWWAGVVAVIALGVALARYGNRNAAFLLIWIGATYGPWWFFSDRTIFSFYAVLFAPLMVLSVVVALHGAAEMSSKGRTARTTHVTHWIAAALVAVTFLWLVFYWPVYTGQIITHFHRDVLLFWEGWR